MFTVSVSDLRWPAENRTNTKRWKDDKIQLTADWATPTHTSPNSVC